MDSICPKIGQKEVLVRTHKSLISSGTDRATLQLGKKNPLKKAIARPDLWHKVWQKIRRDGLFATFKTVRSLMNQPKPLGYSLVGEVIAVGHDVADIKLGQRVACAGQGFACHAEIIAVPKNLCVVVPVEVIDDDACYVTLGAIAMHGIRQAHSVAGNTVMVVGLGLLGQITLQLVRAAGMHAVGIDLDAAKIEFTGTQGFAASHPHALHLEAMIAKATQGQGVDAVLITAGSPQDSTLFAWLVPYCRDRAHVVVVGDVKMAMSRRDYFKKELTVWQSRSYGPGRYDPDYEIAGNDYPIASVRWSENRNMQAFMQLLAQEKISMQALTTHQFKFADFKQAYDLVTGEQPNFFIGILLQYNTQKPIQQLQHDTKRSRCKIRLGFIGVGNFAQTILLPYFIATKKFQLWAAASKTGLSASHVAAQYQASYATTETDTLTQDKYIDAIVIATRHDSHAKYVLRGLRAGKHVFVEKPLCTTVTDLKKIQRCCENSTKVLQVGFNRRFSPAICDIKRFFKNSGAKQLMYRVNAGRVPLQGEAAWLHASGGRLLGEVCHFVDTMIAITSSLPVDVECHAMNFGREDLNNQDHINLVITFADGSVGSIHYITNGHANVPKEYLEVHSEQQSAYLDNFKRITLVRNHSKKSKHYWRDIKGFRAEANAFAKACKTKQWPIPLNELIATHEVTLLALNLLMNPTRMALRAMTRAAACVSI